MASCKGLPGGAPSLLVTAILLGFIACTESGCSVYMASKQATSVQVDVLRIGAERREILNELGLPVLSEDRDGRRYEIFEIVSGASSAVKGGRAAFHYTADLITLGLWEVVATTVELGMAPAQRVVRVRYDRDFRADEVSWLKSAEN